MANLFGVYLKNGTMPKITEPANFLDWSWWFWITPNLHGTVLARKPKDLSEMKVKRVEGVEASSL